MAVAPGEVIVAGPAEQGHADRADARSVGRIIAGAQIDRETVQAGRDQVGTEVDIVLGVIQRVVIGGRVEEEVRRRQRT